MEDSTFSVLLTPATGRPRLVFEWAPDVDPRRDRNWFTFCSALLLRSTEYKKNSQGSSKNREKTTLQWNAGYLAVEVRLDLQRKQSAAEPKPIESVPVNQETLP